MSKVGAKEHVTQKRIINLFKDHLKYSYLGDFTDRSNNTNIEVEILTNFLKKRGINDKLIELALGQLNKTSAIGDSQNLYDANNKVYQLLRYGVKVRGSISQQYQTVWLIDWDNPENNDFAIAEEVTVKGYNTKRPDIVIYINGIAIGVIELKRSIVSVSEGIRQNLASQEKKFIRDFFTTIQFVMAGNDTEGLRYATIETSERYYLEWKEEGGFGEFKLDKHLSLMFEKKRLLELIHDFIVFDLGVKKFCRHNQYFAVKAAQKRIKKREGGIIWHTQGSGKSLIMVWFSKWIRQNLNNSRVLLITDRKELDEQIEGIYRGVSEDIYRTTSGTDLVNELNKNENWLICSLIHKFGGSDKDELSDKDLDKFINEIEKNIMSDFSPKGDIYVFIDECHRTQSGKLHAAMKKIIPKALFIGFTGTPLFKNDKQTSFEVFGPYIHTYKFDEAVKDGVIVDLRYEARDVDQNITSQEKIDLWFDSKTKGLNDYVLTQLKKRWGTMQKLLSSKSRLEKIAADILFDMEIRDRLANGRGNAILVSGSIYEACSYYEMFKGTTLAKKCAIITSFSPSKESIKGEVTGEGDTEKLAQYVIYRKMLAEFYNENENEFSEQNEQFEKKVKFFEKTVKKKFVKEPGQMKLLIVVDKLLTGFDAPSATYIYIDKKMQDHGLFQAICRVNRLDGEDKEYGYVIDYKDLFKSLEKSMNDYTGGAFDKFEKGDVENFLQNRLIKAKEKLKETLEEVKQICENVTPPKNTINYIEYFCGNDTNNKGELLYNENKRIVLYKKTGSLMRAYAEIANDFDKVGYSTEHISQIKKEVEHYAKIRTEIKLASGDYIDLKLYEPSMRHLFNSYIQAEESRKISAFDDLSLIEMIVERGKGAVNSLPEDIKNNHESVAETIENNVRKVIIDEQPVNPKYFERMSELLETLVKERKKQAIEYEEYLQRIVELTSKVKKPETSSNYTTKLNTAAKRALFDNLEMNEELALKVDDVVRRTKKEGFRGNRFKEREIANAISNVLKNTNYEAGVILELVKNQNEY